MMTCPNCGAQAEPSDRFCNACGAPLPAGPISPPPTIPNANPFATTPISDQMPTGYPYATRPINDPSAIYPPFTQYPQTGAPTVVQPAAKSRYIFISRRTLILGGAAVLIAILVGVFVLTRGSSLAGEWYGPMVVTAVSQTQTLGEVYLDLQQGGNGSLTGTGGVCFFGNANSDFTDYTVTGQLTNSHVTLTMASIDAPASPIRFSGTWSADSLKLTSEFSGFPGGGGIKTNMGRGALNAYNALCQNTPAPK